MGRQFNKSLRTSAPFISFASTGLANYRLFKSAASRQCAGIRFCPQANAKRLILIRGCDKAAGEFSLSVYDLASNQFSM